MRMVASSASTAGISGAASAARSRWRPPGGSPKACEPMAASAQPIRLTEALAGHLGQESGLLIVTVEPDGPAHKAGLLQGDTLVTVDGDPLFGRLDALFAVLRSLDVESTHPFGVLRAGEIKEVA